MAYKTYKVRDIVSHRSYPVRKCDIAYTEAMLVGTAPAVLATALVLKHPVRKGNCKFNRNSVIVTDRTFDRMGIAKRPCA